MRERGVKVSNSKTGLPASAPAGEAHLGGSYNRGILLQDEDIGVDLRVHSHFFEFGLHPCHVRITSSFLAVELKTLCDFSHAT